MNLKMIEVLSVGGTAWAVFNIALDVTHKSSSALIGGAVGAVASVIYLRSVVDRSKVIGSTGGLILASIPFVLMWTLNAKTVYSTYLNTYVDSRYFSTVRADTDLQYKTKQLVKLDNKISNKKITIDSSHKANDFILNSSSWKSRKNKEIGELRKVYKNSDTSWREKYYGMVTTYNKAHDTDLPNSTDAIQFLTQWEYDKKLSILKKEDEEINSVKVESKDIKVVELKKQTLIREIGELKKDSELKKTIEKSSLYDLDRFYMIMLMVGIFIEIFMTHSDYWFMTTRERNKIRKIKAEKKELDNKQTAWIKKTSSVELIRTFEQEPEILLNLVGLEKVNRELDVILSTLISWSYNQKPTLKKVEKFAKLENPKTGKKYTYGNFFYTIRKDLKELGLDVSDQIISYSPVTIVEILRNYFAYQRKV